MELSDGANKYAYYRTSTIIGYEWTWEKYFEEVAWSDPFERKMLYMLEYHNPGTITGPMKNSIGVELVGRGAIFSKDKYYYRAFEAQVILNSFWGEGSDLSLVSVKDKNQYKFAVNNRSGTPNQRSISLHRTMGLETNDISAMNIFKDKDNYPTLFEGENAELGEFIRDVLIEDYLKDQTGDGFSFSDENGDYFKVADPITV